MSIARAWWWQGLLEMRRELLAPVLLLLVLPWADSAPLNQVVALVLLEWAQSAVVELRERIVLRSRRSFRPFMARQLLVLDSAQQAKVLILLLDGKLILHPAEKPGAPSLLAARGLGALLLEARVLIGIV